jgi:hypothetical protein
MRLRIVLPKVKPEAIPVPTRCAYAGCGGRTFHLRQEVAKPLRDTVYQEVQVHRYQCLRCKRTFRVYPEGTTRAQTSQRVKGLAVMLYLLGLSYGAVSHFRSFTKNPLPVLCGQGIFPQAGTISLIFLE